MPGFFKLDRYAVEWTNQQGQQKRVTTYLKRTAEKYAELLRDAHGFKVDVREL